MVTGLAVAAWKLAKDAETASRWVNHTQGVVNALAQSNIDALSIELSTQNFRISGDLGQLAKRDATILKREATLAKIKELIADNPHQQENWLQLRRLVSERLAIAKQVEVLRKTEGFEAATAYVTASNLNETTDNMYALLGTMQQEELRLIESRYGEQLHVHQQLLAVGAIFALSLLILLIATYIFIRRQIKQTESSQRARADSEENLSITLESIGDAVVATDVDGRVTRMNSVAERLTGWSIAQALGRSSEDVLHLVQEASRLPAFNPIPRVLATGKSLSLENHTLIIARDGSAYPIGDSAAPILDAAGNIRGVVLVFRDMTAEFAAQNTIREQNERLEQRVQERTTELYESQAHLRSVTNNVPALIAFVDSNQRYVYVNHQYQELFAPERSDIIGCTVEEILGQERYADVAPLIRQALQGEAHSYDWQPFPGVWQAVSYIPRYDANHQPTGYYVLGSDITGRKSNEEKVRLLNTELEQRIRELEHVGRALKALSAGNRAQLHAVTEQELLDKVCQTITVSAGYQMASVWLRQDMVSIAVRPISESGCPGGIRMLADIYEKWSEAEYNQTALGICLRTGQPGLVKNITTDPSYVHWQAFTLDCVSVVACPLRVDGNIIGALSVYSNEVDAFNTDEVELLLQTTNDLSFGISTLRAREEQRKAQLAIARMIRYDGLTGLPNETLFTESLVAAINDEQSGQSFIVVQANIERLSEINLAFGFTYGDQVLREFGARLKACAPASAVVSRLRGDEFAILLHHADEGDLVEVIQKIQDSLKSSFPIGDIFLEISAKIGVAIFPKHGRTSHDLLRNVDIAVHQAQRKSVEYVVFDPSQDQDHSRRLKMAGELKRGIAGGDLRLYLQPKVEIATGRVCGAEALVRWNHPLRGLVPPSEFIGLAEHTGLIDRVTSWVLMASLGLIKEWQGQGFQWPISVNLSAVNLRDDDLLEKIRLALTTQGVLASMLELEITEGAAMDDPEFALSVLRGLRMEGITLSIDDFGTGYSSLAYLQKFPVDYIKIDQSFVRDMMRSKESSLIVRSTVDLVHDLGRRAVAEGVETEADWKQLAAFGCDIAQGYFIAKPMPAEAFPDWVKGFLPPI